MESNYKLLKEETINSTEQPDKIITNNKNNLVEIKSNDEENNDNNKYNKDEIEPNNYTKKKKKKDYNKNKDKRLIEVNVQKDVNVEVNNSDSNNDVKNRELEEKTNNILVPVYYFYIIFIINCIIFSIINFNNYQTDDFHTSNKFLHNLYLVCEYPFNMVFIKRNILQSKKYKRIDYSTFLFASIIIGYISYYNIYNFDMMDTIDGILFSCLFFRFFIYILQIL